EGRTEGMNKKYKNPDNDPEGDWRNDNATVATPSAKDRYAIQSPFTGEIHYPGSRAWGHPRTSIKKWLEDWGSKYSEVDLKDGRPKALLLKGSPVPVIGNIEILDNNPVVKDSKVMNSTAVKAASKKAEKILETSPWPPFYFG